MRVKWRIYLANTFVRWFRQIGFAGWIRFRITRIGYKLLWKTAPRNGEWDFVLQWLSPLEDKTREVNVLDVGSTDSLLIYELRHRGYQVMGFDQRPYQENIAGFLQGDITKMSLFGFDYVVAVSTIEHIGLGAYGDEKGDKGDRLALENIYKSMKDDAYFIITVPNKHFITKEGRSYSYQTFKKLIKNLFRIVCYEERSNQVCAVMVKYQS